MGFEMEWKDENGRKVSRDQWFKGLQDKAVGNALKDIEKDVHREIAALRCPVHGETPKVKTKIVGKSLESEITGCCDDIKAKAQKIATRQE